MLPIDQLRLCLAELQAIPGLGEEWPRFVAWHNGTRPLIQKHFRNQLGRFDDIGRPRTVKTLSGGGIKTIVPDDGAQLAKDSWLAQLQSVIRLEESEIAEPVHISKASSKPLSKKVFVVHGHNDEMKLAAARVLQKLGLQDIILHEQPNSGKTIIEKFEHFADVGYAIIILSPDDKAFTADLKRSKAVAQPRQNVLLEFGFFIGRLGRPKIFPLKHEDLLLPSDLSGLGWTKYDKAGNWQYELIKELQAAGYDVSADRLTRGHAASEND